MDNDSKLLTERYRVINEGMDFWPTKTDPEEPKYHIPVFPANWTNPYGDMSDAEMYKAAYSDEGLQTHADFRDDLHMHLSNSNAIDIMRSLEPYIHLASKQMKIPVKIHHEDYSYSIPINIMIAACKSYLGSVVGKEEPEIADYEEPRQIRKTADVVDFATGVQTPGGEEPVGPRIIHGGRPGNYIKDKVMKILKIALAGKDMGGEFFSVG